MYWLARLVVLPSLLRGLSEHHLSDDPIVQFDRWHRLAKRIRIPNANAVALATAARDGAPSVRMVLLKRIQREGLVFFTNYESRKAQELDGNPRASVLAYWRGMERQVRAEGVVHRVDRSESETYFSTRPRGSQLGAWASAQSREMPGPNALDQAYAEARERFGRDPIPCPPFWGGYRLVPDTMEMWQGRASRLHDRFHYRRVDDRWVMRRLFP